MYRKLHIGIVRFPGSTCDYDTLRWFINHKHIAFFIWHKIITLPKLLDLLVLPGGFAFGDRDYKQATGEYIIDPGAMAVNSMVMGLVHYAAEAQIPILGICNGFQILTKASLLPGTLVQNTSGLFVCERSVNCIFRGRSFFNDRTMLEKPYQLPIAHGYGRYTINDDKCKELYNNGQVFLEYASDSNPNGSMSNIAGVCNSTGTIFGMMPHPERYHTNAIFIRAIENYVFNL